MYKRNGCVQFGAPLGQYIVALQLGFSDVQAHDRCPPDLAERIWQLRELTLTIDTVLHNLVFELRPPALDDLGMAEALRLLVDEWLATSGIAVDLVTPGSTTSASLRRSKRASIASCRRR